MGNVQRPALKTAAVPTALPDLPPISSITTGLPDLGVVVSPTTPPALPDPAAVVSPPPPPSAPTPDNVWPGGGVRFFAAPPRGHLGCYTEDAAVRRLNVFHGYVNRVEECAELARGRKHGFFGIADGNLCWSGTTVPAPASTACNLNRRGGSTYAVSLYDTNRYFGTTRPPALVGCYAYNDATRAAFGRMLGYFGGVQESAVRARSAGYDVFAMWNSGACLVSSNRNLNVGALPAVPLCEGPYDRWGFLMGGPSSLAVYDTEMVLATRPTGPAAA